MTEVVIFDFDGVIADTRAGLFALFKKHSPDMSDEDFCAHFDDNVYEKPRIKFSRDAAAQMHEDYCNMLTPEHVIAAIGPIRRLHSEYRLFIISSGDERGIDCVLKAAGIKQCFYAIYGHNTHTSKVVKFEKIRDRFEVSLERTVFVTDTLGDIREAARMGVATIAGTFGFHSRERLQKGSPYAIAESWDDVEAAIRALRLTR